MKNFFKKSCEVCKVKQDIIHQTKGGQSICGECYLDALGRYHKMMKAYMDGERSDREAIFKFRESIELVHKGIRPKGKFMKFFSRRRRK